MLTVRISKKKHKKVCMRYKILKPRAFCSSYSPVYIAKKGQKSVEYCSSRIVYWGRREKEIYCKSQKFDKNGICRELALDGEIIQLSES
jgi:hypothetical protein